MKRLLLLLIIIGLAHLAVSQVLSPVITANVASQKVLSDKTFTFNVGSAIPYIYNGGSSKLQVGFPYNVVYMDRTFPGDLFVSKGYFPDQIQIRWEVSNNSTLIDHFEIFRKKINERDSVWVDNVDSNGRKWEDFYAEANEIYKYTVIAVGIPGEQLNGYTKTEGMGFRTPLATVTGRVSFTGGNGVKNVVVTASTDDKVPSQSLNFSGSSFIEVPQNREVDFSNGFTFQAYLKFNSNTTAGIFEKNSNFAMYYVSQRFVFQVGGDAFFIPYDVPTDRFVHISAVYDGDSAWIAIPDKILNGQGQLVDTLLLMGTKIAGNISANSSNINIGKAETEYFTGNMDEVRIWNRALNKDEILRDYNRYLTGKEYGFFAYLRMNEGFGKRVYDISKSGSNFNENHGDFVGNIAWSDVVPTIEQLGNRGITDEEGNYIIAGIPFLTDGSAYKFTPLLAPHEFDPGYKILFLSEDAVVHNNINFTDISSFNVNGSVVYRNTNLGVKDVKILIDGDPVYGPDTKPEMTDELGRFEIQVPIGYHFISLEKDGHVFDFDGRWPYDEAHPDSVIRHNFNQNLTFGKPFIDTTLITVVGRVIGGTSSNKIPFGFAQSVNNIGKAIITLDHSSANPELTFDNVNIENDAGKDTISYSVVTEIDTAENRTYTDITHYQQRYKIETKIFTNPATGEFVAKLIPEKFSIVDIAVDNDGANDIKNFFGNRVIDLSTNPTVKKEYLYDDDDNKLDSLEYHIKLNYIYQTSPEIDVTNINDTTLFYGEKQIPFTNPIDGSTATIVVNDNFKYPIFRMGRDYSPKIAVFESYKNFDTDENTRQSIKEAEIKIINDLAIKDNVKSYQLSPEMDGVVIDTFKVGIPNITKSESDLTSFTKTMQINVTVDGNTYSWKPGGNLYRAYIVGQRPKGNNFYTEGPQVPEIILRDPPGSNSYAYIEKGSSYSVSSSYTTDFDNGSGLEMEILLGVKNELGGGLAGPIITTDNKNSGKTGLSFSTTVNGKGEYVQTFQFSERIETSSDPGVVGSMGDVYIGKSYNYFYGETDNLKILPKALADANGVISLGSAELNGTEYTLGIVEGFIMNPDNSDTYFKFTQAHILNKLLPELESRRNNLFVNSRRTDGTLKYRNELPNSTDIRYGIAHSYRVDITPGDTVVYGYFKMTPNDSILTYSFRPEKQTVQDLNNILNDTIYGIDSVRYYNDQIGIWMDAIRLNEAEKAIAIENNVKEQNISFDGAVGSVSRKEIQTLSYNREESRTKNMQFNAQGSLGFKFNGVGFISTGKLNISHSIGISTGENLSQTMEYGYVFNDGNVGDYYSINIYRRADNGIYNANVLEETKMTLPGGFDWGILGGAVGGAAGAGVGAGIGTVSAIAAFLSGTTAISTSGAVGGGAIIGSATAMGIAAGISYIPFTSFTSEVSEKGDLFSPGDIKVSSFDISSPIFSTLGGQTMCPFEGLEYTYFYRNAQGDSVVLNKPTLQREKPEITAEPAEVYNVPFTDKAFFNLKLANNTESADDQWYTLNVVAKSNPYGATMKIDGLSPNQTVLIPANESITKLLSIQPTNPAIMDYDSIGIVIHSTCQYDPTDFIADISDTVYVSAHFQPACTNVEVLEPLDNFVVNVRDNDTMTVRLGSYNLEFDSFESIRFEYKPKSGSIWVPVKYFVNDPLLANKDDIQDTVLINNQPFIVFDWDMTKLKDREYDIRAVSVCSDGSENESTILSGILDGQRPQVFGTPQPGDGILNVEDNLSVQFNEPIEGGLLTPFNFEIKGELNYYQLKHDAYLRFNGTSEYASLEDGISFNDKSFTIEFWVRPDAYTNSVLFSQGSDPAKNLEIGLRDGYKTYFKIGGVLMETDFQFTATVPAEAWQHLAYVFDYENNDMFIYQNDKIILEARNVNAAYNDRGKIFIGKSSVTGSDYFKGSLHELRIWSKYITRDDFYATQYTALSGSEVGLYGYWQLNEAFGDLAQDKAANRHIDVHATWEAYPGGLAWDFSGNNFIQIPTSYFAIIPEMDYTIEFWFKDNNPTDTVCLFSNQKGDGKEGPNLLTKAFSIYATPAGEIWAASKGNNLKIVSKDYFDNTWHHFALVVRRQGNVSSFIDGEQQYQNENSVVGGIAGSKMFLGARKWNNINGTGEDRYYQGKMDEFRLWNLAKSIVQIKLDMNSKLSGDEIGLMVYVPFEGYFEDNLGVIQQQQSLKNYVSDINALDFIPAVGNSFSTDAPNMKDVRPVQPIAYDFVSSEDKIIINPKSYLFPQLEKNIIELTVQDVEDKYGNRLASPVTWTAYVRSSQVHWEDEERYFLKEIYQPFTFISSVKNTGGQQIGFSINNLPPWLTCNPRSGVLNPESTLNITFTVNPALNIGEYNTDIILSTENGFDEKLPLTVKVYKTPPDWKVNQNLYEHSMNLVGQVKIEGVLSTDIFDKVAVFVNDTIRGVASVRYLSDFDSYMVFLNIYGNVDGEDLEFRIWDSSVGQILDNVKPFDTKFITDGVLGNTLNPVIFESVGLYRQYIPLAKGWNWVSFNKLASNQNNLNDFFSSLEPSPGDQAKIHGFGYINYDAAGGWVNGNIDSIDNRKMYQIKISKADTIVYRGVTIVPEDNPLTLRAGWNHISYLPDIAMDVNDALRLYVADTSEIIKSQYAFSMYDPRVGWLGTLDVMKPGLGYMINVRKNAILTYPNSTIYKGAKIPVYSSPPLGWGSDLSVHEGNMSLVAKINVENAPELTINEQMVLGAFINGENRGFVSPVKASGIGYEPFLLTVSNSENGQLASFMLYDGLSGKTYRIEEEKIFVNDAVYGSVQNPLVLTVNGLVTASDEFAGDAFLHCYPNPFNHQVNIDFAGTGNSVTIDVVNANGLLVKQIYDDYPSTGLNKVVWDGRNQSGAIVSSGIYYIRFVNGSEVETIKISKTR